MGSQLMLFTSRPSPASFISGTSNARGPSTLPNLFSSPLSLPWTLFLSSLLFIVILQSLHHFPLSFQCLLYFLFNPSSFFLLSSFLLIYPFNSLQPFNPFTTFFASLHFPPLILFFPFKTYTNSAASVSTLLLFPSYNILQPITALIVFFPTLCLLLLHFPTSLDNLHYFLPFLSSLPLLFNSSLPSLHPLPCLHLYPSITPSHIKASGTTFRP